MGLLASLLGAKTLLGAPGLTTRSKHATRGSWHRYWGLLASLLGAKTLFFPRVRTPCGRSAQVIIEGEGNTT